MRPFTAIYVTQLRVLANRSRILAMGGLGLLGLVVAFAIGRYTTTTQDAADFVALFGLAVLVPVTALVIASAGFGDTVDDLTLVYLWLRPVARWQVVVATLLASLTITAPLTILPVALAPVVMGASSSLVLPAFSAAAVGLLAYATLFTALGLVTKRALMWGLLYILIWEGFVAQAGGNSARLAMRSYTQSIISNATGAAFELIQIDGPWTWISPCAVAFVAIVFTVNRLHRADVP